MGIAMKAYIGRAADGKTYLAGKDGAGKPCLIVTDTWRFEKLCKQNKTAAFPLYILQFNTGAIALLQKDSFNEVSDLS